jgi:transcriptional regulator of acetoin/glycerol metabolism
MTLLDLNQYIQNVSSQWNRFVSKQQVDRNAVRQIVLESWERCMSYGLNPYLTEYNISLSPDELQERLEKNKELIEIAWPILETLIDNIEDTHFRVDLFDAEVYLLKTKGSSRIIEESIKLRSYPGVSKREEHSGTNAIALAYLHKKPIFVIGADHYISLFHTWGCASAPIQDGDGHIIGFVNMTGPRNRIHPHTLGMVVSIAKAIEHNLKLNDIAKRMSMQNVLMENVIESVEKGLMVIGKNGNVEKISHNGQILLGLNDVNSLNIYNLFDAREALQNSLTNTSTGHELTVKSTHNNKNLYMEIKPLKVTNGIQMALATFQEIASVQKLARQFGTAGARFRFTDIVGAEGGLRDVVTLAKKAALSDAKILLQGESGTGKELFAHAIHNASAARKGPFVTLNCAAIPTELIESELFGYEEGTFTGARKGGMMGKFEMADSGTLFLDEISSMPLILQGKLLRFLQSNTFMRLGSTKELEVNIRVIAASNRDLQEEMKKGNFREDLFYRLHVVKIPIPPLRERKEDIVALIKHFIEKHRRQSGKMFSADQDFVQVLQAYGWPGNVRELENVIARAVAVSPTPLLTIQSLPVEMERKVIFGSGTGKVPLRASDSEPVYELDSLEQQHIRQVLTAKGGNIRQAAKELGIARNTLYRKMKKYGIQYD